ncbi:MAG: pyridoxamine 5'-phosphate oxidase family protein [Azonexus sp.]|jgi:predicted pyridoxine 5'-phosphate oxidase superfamily flavin-nucleotide-binding protein|nr:pyridoxamine 5'-phosphate oxidase family protein [Azonexus sp.]
MLTAKIIEATQRSVLCWLATVDGGGQPNVSPKEIFTAFDEQHLVIANIASPDSARNIHSNPAVCVSFIDVFSQKGYKVSGLAADIPNTSSEFRHWAKPLEQIAGSRFPIRSVFVIKATAVTPILAPSYLLYPNETTEQSQMKAAMCAYRVQPLSNGA